MVSPTWAETCAGSNVSLLTVTRTVAAAAGSAAAAITSPLSRRDFVHIAGGLLQVRRHVLGVLLVALEEFQAGAQQIPEFGVAGGWNERALERAVDRLVIGDLVRRIGLVERRAAELLQLGLLVLGLLEQPLAGVVVLRRHVELLDQRERLLVHRLVVAHHVL